MAYKNLPAGKNPPHEINLLVEIPVGESVKYEFDKASGYIMVDRLAASPVMPYPGNYGFIPQTLAGDGDPLDVITWGVEKLYPGAVIAVRPIGVLIMNDDKGLDEKIIAVPVDSVSPAFSHIKDINDLPLADRKRLEYFFTHYKDLDGQGRWAKVGGWGDAAQARQIITGAIANGKNPAPPPATPPGPQP